MSDDLRVNLTGNRSGFQAMLQGARSEAKKFSSELGKEAGGSWKDVFNTSNLAKGAAGFFGFEAIKASIESLIQKATELKEISEQFDMSTDSVQQWEKSLGKAGVSFNTFARAIETLRQKRQAAGDDFKNLEPFRKVGISSDEVFNGNDQEIIKKILQSNASGADVADVLGPRANRMRAALPYLNKMQGKEMPFTPGDIKTLHEAELEMNSGKSMMQKWNLQFGPGRSFIMLSQLFGGKFKESGKSLLDLSTAGAFSELGRRKAKVAGTSGAAGGDAESNVEPTHINTSQAEAKAAKEAKEYADKRAEAEHRVLEAERENMTIADRKLSIEKELLDVKERLHDLDIYGPLTKEEEMERLKLQARGSSLLHELKEKPLNFSADSMSKVGLYSASSLAFNPVLGIQQEQLNELRGIHNTLRVKPDPFQQ